MSKYENRLKKLESHSIPFIGDFEISIVEENEEGLLQTDEGEWLTTQEYAAYCKRNGDIFINGPEDGERGLTMVLYCDNETIVDKLGDFFCCDLSYNVASIDEGKGIYIEMQDEEDRHEVSTALKEFTTHFTNETIKAEVTVNGKLHFLEFLNGKEKKTETREPWDCHAYEFDNKWTDLLHAQLRKKL